MDVQDYLAEELRDALGDLEVEPGLPAADLAAAIAIRVLGGQLFGRDDVAQLERRVRKNERHQLARTVRSIEVPSEIRGTASEAVYRAAVTAAVRAVSHRDRAQ